MITLSYIIIVIESLESLGFNLDQEILCVAMEIKMKFAFHDSANVTSKQRKEP